MLLFSYPSVAIKRLFRIIGVTKLRGALFKSTRLYDESSLLLKAKGCGIPFYSGVC